MQPLNAVPRGGLAADSIRGLITTSPSVTLSYGADWLDKQQNYVSDVTDWLSPGGTISSDITASVHRSCSLTFDADVPFNYLSDFVRPRMTITDNDSGFEATFHLGVYTLSTPTRDLGTDTPTLTFTGYDLLQLLMQPMFDSYEVASGLDPAGAASTLIQSVVPGAEVALTDSGLTLAAPMSWMIDPTSTPPTYLDVVNGLLTAVGYNPIWVDWDGVFHIEPYVDPGQVTYDWTFDIEDPKNIVAEPRTSNIDMFNVPNRWRFVQSNLTGPPVEGSTQFSYTNTDPGSPTSTTNRGRTVGALYSVSVTSYSALVAAAAVQIAMDSHPAETFSVSTYPVPLAWHRDVLLYKDPHLSTQPPNYLPQRRVIVQKWQLTLDAATDMTWTWQTVAPV